MKFDVQTDDELPQNAIILVNGDSAVCFLNGETLGPTNKDKLFRLLKISEKSRREGTE